MLLKAKFLYHTSCPKCNSRDNRAIYSDGSSWCFGCSYWTPSTHRAIEQEKNFLPPPTDLTNNLPLAYSTWLKQYDLPNLSMFQWSPSRNRLISVITPDFWQERSLTSIPKIITHGNKPYKIFPNHPINDTCILVEDLISALKISQLTNSFCLFGTTLKQEHELKLAKDFSDIIVWLDYDKYKKAIETARQIKNLGIRCWVTQATKDPKYYTYNEIQQYINQSKHISYV